MQKQLPTIQMGKHAVTIFIERTADGVKTTARCGEVVVTGVHTMHPKHDRDIEGLRAAVKRFATKLAKDAAGRYQNEQLKTLLFELDLPELPNL